MRLVGIESYTDTQPFADLLRDALAYPLFDGGNVDVRRPYVVGIFPSRDAIMTWTGIRSIGDRLLCPVTG
jgi:hypothetical protein